MDLEDLALQVLQEVELLLGIPLLTQVKNALLPLKIQRDQFHAVTP